MQTNTNIDRNGNWRSHSMRSQMILTFNESHRFSSSTGKTIMKSAFLLPHLNINEYKLNKHPLYLWDNMIPTPSCQSKPRIYWSSVDTKNCMSIAISYLLDCITYYIRCMRSMNILVPIESYPVFDQWGLVAIRDSNKVQLALDSHNKPSSLMIFAWFNDAPICRIRLMDGSSHDHPIIILLFWLETLKPD